jgi:hypothetical protein
LAEETPDVPSRRTAGQHEPFPSPTIRAQQQNTKGSNDIATLATAKPVAAPSMGFNEPKSESVVAQHYTKIAWVRANEFNCGACAKRNKYGGPTSH